MKNTFEALPIFSQWPASAFDPINMTTNGVADIIFEMN